MIEKGARVECVRVCVCMRVSAKHMGWGGVGV